MSPARSLHSGAAPIAPYQLWSAYTAETVRPPTSSTAVMTTPRRRRRRRITSNLNAFRAEPALHLRLNLVELLLRARLETHYQHRSSVRSADQSPTIAEEHANSIDGDDLIPCAEVLFGFVDDTEFLVIGTINPYLGRGYEPRDVCQKLANTLSRIRNDAQEPGRSVKSVVEPVKALRKEHVPGNLAANRSVGLVHLLLDQRVTGFPHNWNSARFFNGFRQCLGRLYVENDRLTLASSRQDITRVDDEENVSPDDFALIIDDSDSVSIAVERNPHVRPILFHGGDKRLDVFGNGRIRVMIGKGAIALAEQATRLDAEFRKELRSNERPGSVAAIKNDLKIAREVADATCDVLDVTIDHVLLLKRAPSFGKLSCEGKLVQTLDVGPENRSGADPQLEAVVLGRIVGAGDLDAANDVQIVLRPVRDRSWDNSDIDYVNAARHETCDKRRIELVSRPPVVAPHRQLPLHSFLGEERGKSASDCCRYLFREILAGHSPNVVLAKNRAREFHRR